MDRDRLIVHHVPPAFTLSRRQLGIEAPRDHRVDNNVLAAVVVQPLRYREERSIASGDACSAAVLSVAASQ